jgi:cell division protein ZapB
MSAELFEELEVRIVSLLDAVNELKLENVQLKDENGRLNEERKAFKSRLDTILKKLEGV